MTTSGMPSGSGYRKPQRPPTQADIQDRERFGALLAESLQGVRDSAEKWRSGLAGLVSLVTAGLLLKGPEAAHDLTVSWRGILTVLAGGGLAAATFGLWCSLRAAAGVPTNERLEDIVAEYGSVESFEAALTLRAAGDLRKSRHALKIALSLLGLAVVAWWWADEAPSSPPARVAVEIKSGSGEKTICGELTSGDKQQLRLAVKGESGSRVVSFADISNIRLTATC